MGVEADGADEGQRLPEHLRLLTWDTFPDYIIKTYGLGDVSDVWELIEQLDGTVMRDQRQPADFETLAGQRKALHEAGKNIRNEAAKRHPDIASLKAALASFEHAIEPSNWSAVMLHEVFDIPFIPSTALDAPEVFDPLRRALAARHLDWSETSVDFDALSRLPVREKRRPGSVRNYALEQALIACRSFWLRHSANKGWSRWQLNQPETLEKNDRTQLVGPCERFVVDMLTASGIEFELPSLNGAWSALDKRLAKERRSEER